jgi:hypothetical protein
VLGLVLNFLGAVLLSVNIAFASKSETIRYSGGTTLGPKGIARAVATRSNTRLGFTYLAVGFGFQMLHEVIYIETSWSVLGLLTLDAILLVALFYDNGEPSQ